jgi:putative flavoprotein involved in K+ transport
VLPDAEPLRPVCPPPAPTEVDLTREGIRTIVWATGYRRTYPWLSLPVLDEHGEIRHSGGVTPVPGLYVLGLNFLRRRKSSFIDGAGEDAREIAEIMTATRDRRRAVA